MVRELTYCRTSSSSGSGDRVLRGQPAHRVEDTWWTQDSKGVVWARSTISPIHNFWDRVSDPKPSETKGVQGEETLQKECLSKEVVEDLLAEEEADDSEEVSEGEEDEDLEEEDDLEEDRLGSRDEVPSKDRSRKRSVKFIDDEAQ